MAWRQLRSLFTSLTDVGCIVRSTFFVRHVTRTGLLVLAILTGSGCGPMSLFKESYEPLSVERAHFGETVISLWIGSEFESTNPRSFPSLLYYSEKRTGPYSFNLWVETSLRREKNFTIRSIILDIPDRDKIELVEKPLTLHFGESQQANKQVLEYGFSLGDNLSFQEGVVIQVHMSFEYPEGDQIRAVSRTFKSVKVDQTLWFVFRTA